MIKFEIPYNLDPAYPEKLLQRPALIPYTDCIYAAAWKDDCDNTRFDITFRSDYPKTYEEYVERIKAFSPSASLSAYSPRRRQPSP